MLFRDGQQKMLSYSKGEVIKRPHNGVGPSPFITAGHTQRHDPLLNPIVTNIQLFKRQFCEARGLHLRRYLPVRRREKCRYRRLCRQVGFSATSSDRALKVREGGASFFHQWGMSPHRAPFSSKRSSSALTTIGTRVVGATL